MQLSVSCHKQAVQRVGLHLSTRMLRTVDGEEETQDQESPSVVGLEGRSVMTPTKIFDAVARGSMTPEEGARLMMNSNRRRNGAPRVYLTTFAVAMVVLVVGRHCGWLQ